MNARHLVLLVEEPSMEAFVRALLPRLLPQGQTFEVQVFQGKDDLLGKLEARLRGYASWLPQDWRLIAVVDRDDDDCMDLKRRLEAAAMKSGLRTRSAGAGQWQVATRIAIEELEAWYFGDWEAVREAYPRAPKRVPAGKGFRDPDAIQGGTWEQFERILARTGYFASGLRKIEAAREIGARIDPQRNRSCSFSKFREAIAEAASAT